VEKLIYEFLRLLESVGEKERERELGEICKIFPTSTFYLQQIQRGEQRIKLRSNAFSSGATGFGALHEAKNTF
jgi:hypothetical protein